MSRNPCGAIYQGDLNQRCDLGAGHIGAHEHNGHKWLTELAICNALSEDGESVCSLPLHHGGDHLGGYTRWRNLDLCNEPSFWGGLNCQLGKGHEGNHYAASVSWGTAATPELAISCGSEFRGMKCVRRIDHDGLHINGIHAWAGGTKAEDLAIDKSEHICNARSFAEDHHCELVKGHEGMHHDSGYSWPAYPPSDIDPLAFKREGIRADLAWFATQMEGKLRQNDHKGGWDNATFGYLQARLIEEIRELEAALMATPKPDRQGWTAKVIQEACDVANFCMMISTRALDEWAAPVVNNGDPDDDKDSSL